MNANTQTTRYVPESVIAEQLKAALLDLARNMKKKKPMGRDEWAYLAVRMTADENMARVSHTDGEEEDSPYFPVQVAQNTESIVIFRESLSRLSKDAQCVVRLVIDTPESLYKLMATTKTGWVTAGSLSGYLQGYYAWPKRRVNKVFNEIKSMLRGL